MALAEQLSLSGHDVTLVTHRSLLETGTIPPVSLTSGSLITVPVDSDPAKLLAGPAAQAVRHGNLRALNRSRHLFADFLHAFAAPTAAALEDGQADVLVASTFATAATHVAMQRSIPVVRAHLWPEYPGYGGPMPLAPYSWLAPAAVRGAARRGLSAMEVYLGGLEGHWRRGRLELTARHPVGFTTNTHGALHAYSAAVVPPEQDQLCVTGWWARRPSRGLSAHVERALSEPGPWVCIGFGSMPQSASPRLLEVLSGAVARVGVRALVQLPEGSAAAPDFPGVVTCGYEPHDLLFSRMDAVVHHGGSGTCGAAVRCGVPSVVVPYFGDQFFWGYRLAQLGVAPPPVPRLVLTVGSLARRIEAALATPMRQRAAELGRQVALEDGPGAAVRYLEGRLRSA